MRDPQQQFEDQQALQPYLLPSERLLWSGRPPSGFLLRKSDAFLIPFSLLWGGFAVFWEITAYNGGAPFFFLVFGGFFVVIGLFLMVGRFFVDMAARQKTVYGVTNERALILAGIFQRSVNAIRLRSVPTITLELASRRSGTITFGPTGSPGSGFSNPSWPGTRRVTAPTFEAIENGGDVYQLIQSQLHDAPGER